MKHDVDYSLYLCTDRALMRAPTVEQCVEQAVKGGCTVVQLREKECPSREFYELALRVKAVTERYSVPLIINDRVDIALASDAHGVHVGQGDLPAAVVRRIIGADKILGVSASTLEEAVKAQEDGADYIGVGAMFSTATKTDAKLVTMEELMKIRAAVSVPIVVIGGINQETAPLYKGSCKNGHAVVSAIVAQPDIEAAARGMRSLFGGNA